MTPAINFLKKQKLAFVVHKYKLVIEPNNYGQAVADTLNIDHHRLFKTLLVSLNGDPKKLAVCIVPVSGQLNLRAAAKSFDVKKLEMSDSSIAEKTTGYVIGGISPFGQKKRLPTLLHASALQFDTILASAGKRGLQLEFNPNDLITSLNAKAADIAS